MRMKTNAESQMKRNNVEVSLTGASALRAILPISWSRCPGGPVTEPSDIQKRVVAPTKGLALAELVELGERLGVLIPQLVEAVSKDVREGKERGEFRFECGTSDSSGIDISVEPTHFVLEPAKEYKTIEPSLFAKVLNVLKYYDDAADGQESIKRVTGNETDERDCVVRLNKVLGVTLPYPACKSWTAPSIVAYVEEQKAPEPSESERDFADEWGSAPGEEPLGGVKADGGKLRWDLLPLASLRGLVRVLMHGSKKYADNNWKIVPNAEVRYISAALRHLDAHQAGDMMDDESGELHLYHAMACLWMATWHALDGDWE